MRRSLFSFCLFIGLGLTVQSNAQVLPIIPDSLLRAQDSVYAQFTRLEFQLDEETNDSLRKKQLDQIRKLHELNHQLGEMREQIELSFLQTQLKKALPDSLQYPYLEKLAGKLNGRFKFDSALLLARRLLALAQKNKEHLYELKANS